LDVQNPAKDRLGNIEKPHFYGKWRRLLRPRRLARAVLMSLFAKCTTPEWAWP
jgi:hypothetical protein